MPFYISMAYFFFEFVKKISQKKGSKDESRCNSNHNGISVRFNYSNCGIIYFRVGEF